MIKRISHVGVVVDDIDKCLAQFERTMGLKPSVVKYAFEGKLRIAFIPVGDGEIELIQPLDQTLPLAKFLQTNGPGTHHIALATDDIESQVDSMRCNGAVFAEKSPMIGAHGVKIIFTKPETTAGLTFEICETSKEDH